jgi:hypothetical protein
MDLFSSVEDHGRNYVVQDGNYNFPDEKQPVVGEVTVSPLLHYVSRLLFKESSDDYITFENYVTRCFSGTNTFKIR